MKKTSSKIANATASNADVDASTVANATASNADVDASTVANATVESTKVHTVYIPMFGNFSYEGEERILLTDESLYHRSNSFFYGLVVRRIANEIASSIGGCRIADSSAVDLSKVVVESYFPKDAINTLKSDKVINHEMIAKMLRSSNLASKETTRKFNDASINRAWEVAHRVRNYAILEDLSVHTVITIVLGLIIPASEASAQIRESGKWFKGYIKALYGGKSIRYLDMTGEWVSANEAAQRLLEERNK